MSSGLPCPPLTHIIQYMSFIYAHTTIYCVYFLPTPQDIVSALALDTASCVYLPRTADRTQATNSGTGSAGAASTRGPLCPWCPGGQRAQLRRAAHDRDRGQDKTADAPTVDRWTDGQMDRWQDRRQGWTGAASDGHRGGREAADSLTLATVAAGHEESPWTAWKRS